MNKGDIYMDMTLVYKILGKDSQRILASYISQFNDICNEIMSFEENNSLNRLIYYSPVFMRVREKPKLIEEISLSFKSSVEGLHKNGVDINELIEFSNKLNEFVRLAKTLEICLKKDQLDPKDNVDLLIIVEKLKKFLERENFYVEDCRSTDY